MNMTPRSGVSQLIAQRRALAAALVDATTADNPEQVLLTLAEVLAIVRMGETAWRRGVKDGLYPKPVVFSKRKIFWRAVDIDALLQRGNLAADEEKKPAKRARR